MIIRQVTASIMRGRPMRSISAPAGVAISMPATRPADSTSPISSGGHFSASASQVDRNGPIPPPTSAMKKLMTGRPMAGVIMGMHSGSRRVRSLICLQDGEGIVTADLRRPRHHAFPAAGSQTVKVAPSPSRLSIASWPRWRLTMCLTIARPSPVPPTARDRPLSTR